MKLTTGIGSLVAVAIAGTMPDTAAFAQTDDEASLEQITVTARKREESLQEVPVAISAFGRGDIEQFDLRQLENVADLTPGFQFKNQGNQQPGRYNTQLQFRGLTTAQFSPSFATGALFIDGVYVLNGGTSLSLGDIERVEVIKGPQSAYFGRNTFGGAVNMITRDPNAESWGGEVSASFSDRSNTDASFFVEGPLVENVLSASLGGRIYDKTGHYNAPDGASLGDERTEAINIAVKWTPTEDLSFKFRYGRSEDSDGAPAQAFISGILNDSCTGLTINTPEGQANPQRYICGQVPDIETASFAGAGLIAGSTILPDGTIFSPGNPNPPTIQEALANPSTNIADVPEINGIGLRRETDRFSLAASYDFLDGYSLEFVAGYNEQGANWIRDFDLSDRVNWFSRDPQYLEDKSYELRLVGPQDGRLRWLVGVNAYEQEFISSGGGGDAVTACFSSLGGPTDPLTDDFSTCIPGFNLLFTNSLQNTDEAEVLGVFAAVDFDINDQWTVILEGRYQDEEFTKGGGLTTPGAPILTETFDDFLPRAILRYTPNETSTFFISYAEGLIAGDFNTFFINADARERQQYLDQDPNVAEALEAETLNAIEFGWKQSWLDGRIQTNLAIYRNEWENIKGRSSFLINETCRDADVNPPSGNPATGCNPGDGISVGDPKQIIDPGTGMLTPFFNSRNILLPGDATIQGVEVESWFRPADNTVITANVSYIDSEYDDYLFNFVAPIAGFSQMRGNQTPRQPEWSGNATLTQYFDSFGRDAFVRAEYIYQGKSFVDESNLAFIDSYGLFNLRGGFNTDKYLVELFIKNLFDEDAWSTGARWTDFSSPTQFGFLTAKQGVAVSPQDRREYGIRATLRFGSR